LFKELPRRQYQHCEVRRQLYRVAATVTRSSPHTPAGNWTTARGRSPGSRVVAFIRLPEAWASVAFRTNARRLQLRGQPRNPIAFPFHLRQRRCLENLAHL